MQNQLHRTKTMCGVSHDFFNKLGIPQCFPFLQSQHSFVLFIQKFLKVFYIQFSHLSKPISLIMASAHCENELAALKQSKASFNLSPRTTESHVTQAWKTETALETPPQKVVVRQKAVLYAEKYCLWNGHTIQVQSFRACQILQETNIHFPALILPDKQRFNLTANVQDNRN